MFQIVYDEATKSQRDPGFEPLDNSSSEHPDWFEYWPIRRFFRDAQPDTSTFYGFFSPQFFEKTRLNSGEVRKFVYENGCDVDVLTFSPFPCHSASFLNVFEQGNFFHPGLLGAASDFFFGIGERRNLRHLVNHSANTVYCNFFLAKPAFWDDWGQVCDKLFDACELEKGRTGINAPLIYAKENGAVRVVERKVFIMERVVSYLLAVSDKYVVRNYPQRDMPVSTTHANLWPQIFRLDSLKRRLADTGESGLLGEYRKEQAKVIAAAWPGRRLPDD